MVSDAICALTLQAPNKKAPARGAFLDTRGLIT